MFLFAGRSFDIERSTRTAAKALIIKDGKMLAVKVSDGNESWYIMPGGGIQSEESIPEALIREVGEETGLLIEPGNLAFVIEGVHGERSHRIDPVFECQLKGNSDSERIADGGQIGFDRLDIATLNHAPLYPSRLRRAVMNRYNFLPHPVYLGNEEIGDPEITD